MIVDDLFATYDLSLCIALSTPNIMQNVEVPSAFLCIDSMVADGVIRSSMYAGSCVYTSFPDSPGSTMLVSFTLS